MRTTLSVGLIVATLVAPLAIGCAPKENPRVEQAAVRSEEAARRAEAAAGRTEAAAQRAEQAAERAERMFSKQVYK